ncbi:hypothetical protein M8C21_005814 [Ambrosia artemisiifolia]|uniref:Uncharacterized protein n=1 Tax=Ambrosia artemisiifolia TaxID=4212 RepID=A0AAD5CXT9_AMBAR|nr:hypothetical protein M8C21_005814 [Ambrosia artemisiifolia]
MVGSIDVMLHELKSRLD